MLKKILQTFKAQASFQTFFKLPNIRQASFSQKQQNQGSFPGWINPGKLSLSLRVQLERIIHRGTMIILATQHATETKTSRRWIAHHPLGVNRFMNIQILGTSQTQSFDPLGHEVASLLMQIWNVAGIQRVERAAGEAAKIWWEKGRCWCWRSRLWRRWCFAIVTICHRC